MRADLGHFTLDGRPLCTCSCIAYADRMRAAGSPPCSDLVEKQAARFAHLAAQFPGRVALVHGGCTEDATRDAEDAKRADVRELAEAARALADTQSRLWERGNAYISAKGAAEMNAARDRVRDALARLERDA